jgi:hypothetical protein
LKRLNFQKIWLAAYAFLLCLFPAIEFHGRSFFAAEWGLIPLILFYTFQKNKSKPPSYLILVWGTLLVAFVAGIWRGELSNQMTIYIPTESDVFKLSKDGVRLGRWLVLFSTPWLIKESFLAKPVDDYLDFFRKILRWAAFASAALGILEQVNILTLVNMGYHQVSPFWVGRLYGTFPSPLESSLFYSFVFFDIVVEKFLFMKTAKDSSALLIAPTLFIATLLSRGGSALVSLALAFAILSIFNTKKARSPVAKLLVMGSLFVTLIGLYFLSPVVQGKAYSFLVRFDTWKNWFKILPSHPFIIVTGIGFSNLVVDNSYITLIIKFGLLGFLCIILWLRELSENLTDIWPLLLFWMISWISLDSIGYWGIGRAMWLILGLASLKTSSDKQRRPKKATE